MGLNAAAKALGVISCARRPLPSPNQYLITNKVIEISSEVIYNLFSHSKWNDISETLWQKSRYILLEDVCFGFLLIYRSCMCVVLGATDGQWKEETPFLIHTEKSVQKKIWLVIRFYEAEIGTKNCACREKQIKKSMNYHHRGSDEKMWRNTMSRGKRV